jgi:hypothetical protein
MSPSGPPPQPSTVTATLLFPKRRFDFGSIPSTPSSLFSNL